MLSKLLLAVNLCVVSSLLMAGIFNTPDTKKISCSYINPDPKMAFSHCQSYYLAGNTSPFESKVNLCQSTTSEGTYFSLVSRSTRGRPLFCLIMPEYLKNRLHSDTDGETDDTVFVNIQPQPDKPTSEQALSAIGMGGGSGFDDDGHKPRKPGGGVVESQPPYFLSFFELGSQLAGELFLSRNIAIPDIAPDQAVTFATENLSDGSQLMIVHSGDKQLIYRRRFLFSDYYLLDTTYVYQLPDPYQSYRQQRRISTLIKSMVATMSFTYREDQLPVRQAPVSDQDKKTDKNQQQETTAQASPGQKQVVPGQKDDLPSNQPGKGGNTPPSGNPLACTTCGHVAPDEYSLKEHIIELHGGAELQAVQPSGSIVETSAAVIEVEAQALPPLDESYMRHVATFWDELMRALPKQYKGFINKVPTVFLSVLESYLEKFCSETPLEFRIWYKQKLEQKSSAKLNTDFLLDSEVFRCQTPDLYLKLLAIEATILDLQENKTIQMEGFMQLVLDKLKRMRAQNQFPPYRLRRAFPLNREQTDHLLREFAVYFIEKSARLTVETPGTGLYHDAVFLLDVFNALKKANLLPEQLNVTGGFDTWLSQLYPDMHQPASATSSEALQPTSLPELYERNSRSLISGPRFIAGVMLLNDYPHIRQMLLSTLQDYEQQLTIEQQKDTDLQADIAALWFYLLREVPTEPIQKPASIIDRPSNWQEVALNPQHRIDIYPPNDFDRVLHELDVESRRKLIEIYFPTTYGSYRNAGNPTFFASLLSKAFSALASVMGAAEPPYSFGYDFEDFPSVVKYLRSWGKTEEANKLIDCIMGTLLEKILDRGSGIVRYLDRDSVANNIVQYLKAAGIWIDDDEHLRPSTDALCTVFIKAARQGLDSYLQIRNILMRYDSLRVFLFQKEKELGLELGYEYSNNHF